MVEKLYTKSKLAQMILRQHLTEDIPEEFMERFRKKYVRKMLRKREDKFQMELIQAGIHVELFRRNCYQIK